MGVHPFTEAERYLADKVKQVSRSLETVSESAAKTAGELAEAVELLQLAQGHMLELAATTHLISEHEIKKHTALTKRVFQFIEAYTPPEHPTAWTIRRCPPPPPSFDVYQGKTRMIGPLPQEKAQQIADAMNKHLTGPQAAQGVES